MTTIKALHIPFDGDKPVEKLDFEVTLENIYALVAPDSRLYEQLRGEQIELFGDEEALLRADAFARINARAMQIFAHDQQVGVEDYTSPLCGDFLVVGPLDDEGDSTDAPDWVFDFRFSWVARTPA